MLNNNKADMFMSKETQIAQGCICFDSDRVEGQNAKHGTVVRKKKV